MAINRVEANGETLIDLTSDTATANDVIEGKTLHLASGTVATGTYRPSDEIEARLRATVGHSSKNLLKIDADSQTKNGVTFTVDKTAGTITASGTATADAQFDFQGSSLKSVNNGIIKNGLIFSCEGTNRNLVCSISYYNSSGTYISEQQATTSGTIISIPPNAHSYKFWVRKRPAAGSETFIFKPMLRDGSISDDTFEPYQMPTDERVAALEAYVPTFINHNSTFRGEDLTNVYTVDEIYQMVSSGKFDDLFLGDYFTKSITTDIYTKFTGTAFENGVTYYERSGADLNNWTYTETSDASYDSSKTYYTKLVKTENVTLMFAAFDYYYNCGNSALTTHHAILIPRNYGFATTAKMNPTNTTVGSYYNSEMHQTTLPCYAKSLKTALGNHLLSHKTLLPNAINASTPSMAGVDITGASSNWAWVTTELQLMTEQQVYGTRAWTSSGYDIGIDYRILPVFNFINPVFYGRNSFWLRSVVSSTNFASYTGLGNAYHYGASNAGYVRPLIVFG